MKTTMVLPKRILIDSNILIYAIDETSEKHIAVQKVFEDIIDANTIVFISHQNIIEVLRVMTGKYKKNAKEVIAVIDTIMAAFKFRVIKPHDSSLHTLFNILGDIDVPGKRIFDLYLAATAIDNALSFILTENVKDFEGISGIEALNPFI